MKRKSSANRGYIDIFAKDGTRTRCWNRRDPTIGPKQTKHLRLREASVQELVQFCEGATTDPRLRIGKVSMSDIEKALRPKEAVDPKTKLPKRYWPWLDVFSQQLANKLSPNRPGIDHRIQLRTDSNGSEVPPPYGPLYGMNQEELLVLRKTLTELLDKNFIRVSRSPAASPVWSVSRVVEFDSVSTTVV